MPARICMRDVMRSRLVHILHDTYMGVAIVTWVDSALHDALRADTLSEEGVGNARVDSRERVI